MDLPQSLRTALERELSPLSTAKLAALATDLSGRYRDASPAPGAARHVRGRDDAAAYAAYRMPATFAAIHSALVQVQARLADWAPESLLDVGAGPGTAMWAATAIWPGLKRIALLEREKEMIRIGQTLADACDLAPVREAAWQETDMAGPWDAPVHDLVVASYVFNELSAEFRPTLARKLWNVASGVLLVVEPGTPRGFAIVKQVRDDLLAAGARMVAPCPHDRACPSDWCHFSQRIARTRLHRQIKAGGLSYEDEKFSFIAFSRLDSKPIHARVVRHPQIHKGHIRLELCTADGLKNTVITRRDKDLYQRARDWRWGSSVTALEEPEEVCYSDREPGAGR